MVPSRTSLVAGNWKMNGLLADGLALARQIAAAADSSGPQVLLCPPATLLAPLAAVLEGSPVVLGGQDCHAAVAGAHTGDIAAAMLAELGCRFAIVGHSERRADHGESDADVLAKASAVQDAGLTALVCIGESEDQRGRGETLDVLTRQVMASVPQHSASASLVIAYEPVWAIGSGRTPAVDDVARAHSAIRVALAQRIGPAADAVRLLYGGSITPDNAAAFLAVPDVDGVLVGGASLRADDFLAICRAAAGPSGG